NFQTVFLPDSLLVPVDHQVQEIMPQVFNRLVYPGLRAELEQRTGELLRATQSTPAAAPAPTPQTTASARLSAFTDSFLKLESNIVWYNGLAPKGRGQGKDLLALSSSLSPQTFAGLPSRNTSGLDSIVISSSGPPFEGQPWNKPAAAKLEALVTDVLRQSTNEEQLLIALDTLLARIKLLEENK